MTDWKDRHEQDETATVADPWSPREPEPADDRRDDFDPVAAAKRFPWLTGLVATHVLVATMVMAWWTIIIDDFSETRGQILEVLSSVSIAQGSLLGIWAAMAGCGTPWRFSLLIFVLVGGTWFVALPDRSQPRPEIWLYFVLAQMLGTCVPFFVLRFFGLQVRQSEPDPALPRRFRPQFTIMAMLQWMAAVAVLFGTVPLMPEEFRRAFTSPREVSLVLGVFGIDAIIGVTALWLTLGNGRLALRIIAMLVIAVALAVFLVAHSGTDIAFIISFSVLYPLWLLASLAVLRRLGYRVGWRRASGGRVSPEPSPGATIS